MFNALQTKSNSRGVKSTTSSRAILRTPVCHRTSRKPHTNRKAVLVLLPVQPLRGGISASRNPPNGIPTADHGLFGVSLSLQSMTERFSFCLNCFIGSSACPQTSHGRGPSVRRRQTRSTAERKPLLSMLSVLPGWVRPNARQGR